MWLWQALTGAFLFASAGAFFKALGDSRGATVPFFTCFYGAGGAALAVFSWATREPEISLELLLAGMLIGTGSAAGNLLFLRALAVGPISLTSPVINFNVVYLVIGSVVFFGERLGLLQSMLVALIIVSVLLLPFDPKENRTIRSGTWYGLVLTASLFLAIRNGGLKVTESLGLDNAVVLAVAYLAPFIAFAAALSRNRPQDPARAAMLGAAGGVLSIAGMGLFATALSGGPASLVIPVFSTYNAFLVVFGYALFRERLTPVQIASVLTIAGCTTLLRQA